MYLFFFFLFFQLQQLVVSGELACSKEEAASLACIQLRIEETWAPPTLTTPNPTPVPTPVHQVAPQAPSLKIHSPNQLSIASTGSSTKVTSPGGPSSLQNDIEFSGQGEESSQAGPSPGVPGGPRFSFSNSNSAPTVAVTSSSAALMGPPISPTMTTMSLSLSHNHRHSKVNKSSTSCCASCTYLTQL